MHSLLPQITDRHQYKELFPQNSVWEPAIKHLVVQHQLKGPIHRGNLGSHILYQVGDSWVKLMAPIFVDEMVYEISGLQSVSGKLSVSTPNIIAQGQLDGWPYVILSHVEGQPIRYVWPQLDQNNKLILCQQMAKVTKEISQCPYSLTIKNRFYWNAFIQKQYEFCMEQQKQKLLPNDWLQNVENFLSHFSITEFKTDHPVFLHADLTFDHFLISTTDDPKICGIIDMADCQVGHPEYDLIAVCAFLLKGQTELLQKYLTSYGFTQSELNTKLSEKLLAWCLLNRYYSFITYFKTELETVSAGDFKELAKIVFPL